MLDSSHLHHMETEQALLGAFFLKPALVTETASLVAPEDFRPGHFRDFFK